MSPRTEPALSSTGGLLGRASKFFALLGFVYVGLVALLTIPFFQNHALYLNAVKLPFNADFDVPEKYGLAPGKTWNTKITTSDNITLGAWFILSDPYYHTLSFPPPDSAAELHVTSALQSHPTILFFHGNAATRAHSKRVQYYSQWTSRLGVNVFAIDYRGFADSEGTPSEEGLARDSRASFDWLISHGAKAEDILLVGHSLGTGVVGRLGIELLDENIKYRGAVLFSAFSSIHSVIDTYYILKCIPVMMPLAMIPYASEFVKSFIITKFNTLSRISDFRVPLLLVHGQDDRDIPFSHSDVLFNSLVEPHLPPIESPPLTPGSWSTEEWIHYRSKHQEREQRRQELVTRTVIANFAVIDEFSEAGEKIILAKTYSGQHNEVAHLEGVHEIMKSVFNLL